MSTGARAGADQRPMRADGRRNRELVLAAARAAFAEGGPDVSVAEIARAAGVGTATLFRHFATKDELLDAVLDQLLDGLGEAVEAAAALPDPWEGFAHAITTFAEMQAANRMFLRSAGPERLTQERFADRGTAMMDRMGQLIERAQAAGVVRGDLTPEDIPFILSAVGGSTEQCAPVTNMAPDLWRRYFGIVLDGLRPEGARPLAPDPPTYEQLTMAKYGHA